MATVQQLLDKKESKVHSIGPAETVLQCLEKMADKNVGALVVLDGEKLVGIVSERDYARKVYLKGRSSPKTKVEDIMSRRVVCARPEQTVEECMAVMTDKAIRHLPVLDHKQVIGVVSIGDLVKSIISEQKFIIEQLEHYITG